MTTSYDKGGRSYGTAGSVTRTAYFKAEAIGGPGYGLTLSTTVTLTSPAAANEYAEGYFDGMDTAEASETQVRVHANQVTISTTGGTE